MNRFKYMTWIIRLTIIILWIGCIFGVLWIATQTHTPQTEKNTLQVFAWSEMFVPEIIARFEKETGIKIKIHRYTTNEELLIKLKASQGKGYDLTNPSDYAVQILIKENLLKKIDHSKLDFLDQINPTICNYDYDPGNKYSIPYEWEVYCFGIDKTYFQNEMFNPSWSEVFSPPKKPYRIAMVNDPIEAVNFASFYLFGYKDKLNAEQTEKVHTLLNKQKKWVEAYAGLRADYLLTTKNCHVALCSSSYAFRAAKESPDIQFIIPKEGSFISIENMCIPIHSKKEDLVYKFLNYVYRPDNLGQDCSTYYNFPATMNTSPYLNVPQAFKDFLNNSENYAGKLHMIHHVIPEEQTRSIWIDIKS